MFQKAGFEIQGNRFFCKAWLQDLSIWSALDNPLVGAIPRYLGRTAWAVNRMTGWGGDVATTLVDDYFGCWMPDAWASKVIVRLRKSS